MKVLPSNQALILAGEPAGRRTSGDALLEQASRLVSGTADLKRVTIMSAQPDSTVVVQADYFSAHENNSPREPTSHNQLPADDGIQDDGIQTVGSRLPAIQQPAQKALTPVIHELRTGGEPAVSYPLKPTQLYARTQRGYQDTKTSLLDVLA